MLTKVISFLTLLLLIFGLIMGGSLTAQDGILVFNTQSVIAKTTNTGVNSSVDELTKSWANVNKKYNKFQNQLDKFINEVKNKTKKHK